jgi:SAM-dependent methyltransferase
VSRSVQFVDPDDRTLPLTRSGDWLESAAGRRYPIVGDIPRFVDEVDPRQAQTAGSFGYKWTRGVDWGFKPGHQEVVWAFWRDVFGWESPADLQSMVSGKIVLDAGCGSGMSLGQFVDWPAEVAAVDISQAIDSCRGHFGDRPHVSFAQADLCRLPFADEVFDVVWSNGVLHHTPSVFASLQAIVRHLKRGGLVIFYIYVKKPPIREFVDDHVRGLIAPAEPEEAWRRAEAITALGRSLSAITQPLEIVQDVPELGIVRGTYNLQRFLYYHVMKCYWNDALSFDDNTHVNFDWYHPMYAHRHSADEVRGWLSELSLDLVSLRVSQSGLATVARKREAPRA